MDRRCGPSDLLADQTYSSACLRPAQHAEPPGDSHNSRPQRSEGTLGSGPSLTPSHNALGVPAVMNSRFLRLSLHFLIRSVSLHSSPRRRCFVSVDTEGGGAGPDLLPDLRSACVCLFEDTALDRLSR